MTIREMLKKVNTYNELASIRGTDKLALRLEEQGPGGTVIDITNHFVRDIRATYIQLVADELIKFDGYEFDEDWEFEVTDRWGYTHQIRVIPSLVIEW